MGIQIWTQVELQKATPIKPKEKNHQTLSREELMSYWDLVGSERTDRTRPENMLQLEASSEWESPHGDTTNANVSNTNEGI